MAKISFFIGLLQFVVISMAAQYQVNWHNLTNISVDPTTNVLTKTSYAAWNAGALSTNKLAANTDGKITYVINGNEHYVMFGLAEYNDIALYTSIPYKFYLYGTTNKQLSGYGAVSIGDTLILERLGSQIIYRKHSINGTQQVLNTVSTDPTKELYVDVSMHIINKQLNNLYCSFQDGLTIEQNTLHHQNTTHNTLGSIDVNITGLAPLSYSWSNGATTQDISNLTAGTYTLTVTDGLGENLNKTFIINAEESYQVNWHNLTNVSVNPSTNVLTKTSYAAWNAGALSTNKLAANTDGKITYVINGNEHYVMFGLAEYNDIALYTSIPYKFYLYGTTNKQLSGYGAVDIGDTLILERLGNQIIYRKHAISGTQQVLSTVSTDPTKELYVDVSMHIINKQLNNLHCSFYTPLNVPYHPLTYELIGGYYNLSGSELHFSYYQRYTPSSSDLNYEIIDKTNTSVSVTLPVIPVTQGENHLTIDFSTLGLASGYYTLKVTNEKNEIKQLRFKI